MINLLPESVKDDIKYARRNTILLRWLAVILLTTVGLLFTTGVGRFYLASTISNTQKQLEIERQTFDVNELNSVNKELEEISGNVKLAVQVLSKEILFSRVLRQLGSVTPGKVVLRELQIDNSQNVLYLNIRASDIDAATQFQLNIQDQKNQLFQKADIETINCGGEETNQSEEGSDKYPCQARIKALFVTPNPFLFLTNKPTGTSQ